MTHVPESARALARDARSLSADLDLATGQPGLASMASAVGVVDALATTTHAAVSQVSLVAEYIRAECEAGRVRTNDDEPHADVTDCKGRAFLAARSAIPALTHAARALALMDDAVSPLESAGGPLAEVRGLTARQADIANAMNLVQLMLLGDAQTVANMAEGMTDDELYALEKTVDQVHNTLAVTRESRLT